MLAIATGDLTAPPPGASRPAGSGPASLGVARPPSGAQAATGNPASLRNRFSAARCWVVASTRAPGRTTVLLRGGGDRGAGDVLELEGEQVDPGRKRRDGGHVVVGADHLPLGYLPRGRTGFRGVDLHAVTESGGGERQHAAELTATENAEDGAGCNCGGGWPHVSHRVALRDHTTRYAVRSEQSTALHIVALFPEAALHDHLSAS